MTSRSSVRELTITCKHCGEAFVYVKKSHGGRYPLFCSKRCQLLGSGRKDGYTGELTLSCRHCGKSFTYIKTAGPQRMYCSSRCAHNAGMIGKVSIGEFTTDCKRCGESFTYVKTVGPVRKYCSADCQRHNLRRCACGSPDMDTHNGKPVCPDCRKKKRDPEVHRRQRLRLYGLSQVEFDELLTLQRGRCAICATDQPGIKGWHIDHDHACCPGVGSCGVCIRGLLCHGCNMVLGYARDSVETLDRAEKYLLSSKPFGQKLRIVGGKGGDAI